MNKRKYQHRNWLKLHKSLGVFQLKKHMRKVEAGLSESAGDQISNPIVRFMVERFLELEYLIHILRNKLADCEPNAKEIKQYKDMIGSQRKVVEVLNGLIGNEIKDSSKKFSMQEWIRQHPMEKRF